MSQSIHSREMRAAAAEARMLNQMTRRERQAYEAKQARSKRQVPSGTPVRLPVATPVHLPVATPVQARHIEESEFIADDDMFYEIQLRQAITDSLKSASQEEERQLILSMQYQCDLDLAREEQEKYDLDLAHELATKDFF